MNSETPRSAITIVVDRLGAPFLGPYGNTWLDTPGFNRWAAEGFLSDWMIIDSPHLADIYRSYWYGTHARSSQRGLPERSLVAAAREAGIHCALITDEPSLASLEEAQQFSELITIPPPEVVASAPEASDTQIARVFSTVVEFLENRQAPYWLWVHSQGMSGAWDAPYSMRTHFADEDDPPPPTFVLPPNEKLTGKVDPDLLLGFQQAYAAQVAVLDECVGLLFDAVNSDRPVPGGVGGPACRGLRSDLPLTMITSPRGFPLGLHGGVGEGSTRLLSELCHVPCVICWPDRRWAARRSARISQPADIAASLAEWFGISEWLSKWGQSNWGQVLVASESNQPPMARWGACFSGDEAMIRTPAWLLTRNSKGDSVLFSKPDDRWEVNELSNRCRSESAALLDALSAFEGAAAANDRSQLPELPLDLLHPPE